jgi:hypothetical protein
MPLTGRSEGGSLDPLPLSFAVNGHGTIHGGSEDTALRTATANDIVAVRRCRSRASTSHQLVRFANNSAA